MKSYYQYWHSNFKVMNNFQDYQVIEELLKQPLRYRNFIEKFTSYRQKLKGPMLANIVGRMRKRSALFEKYMFGNIFPMEVEELGGFEDFYVRPESIENEISWILLQVRLYKDKIHFFVENKQIFERFFLYGMYDDALSILEDVKKNIGVSIWYYESKLLVYEYMGKPEEKYKLISDVNMRQGTKHPGFVTSLLHFVSYRATRNLSAYKYDLDLEINYQRNRTAFQKYNCDYFLFRLNFFKHYGIDNIEAIFTFELTNSLVDRYLLLINVLQVLFISGKKDVYVANKAKKLHLYTNDSIWISMFVHQNPESVPRDYYDIKYINILDFYYQGRYTEVLDLSKEYVKTQPSSFDIIILYCRSLLSLKKDFSHIANIESPLNQITQKVYHALSSDNEDNDILYNLYQINKNLYSFHLSYGLDYFIKEEENKEKDLRLKTVSITVFDPIQIQNSDYKEASTYLANGANRFGNLVILKHYNRRISHEEIPEGEVSPYICDIDNAKLLYKNEQYFESKSRWLNILELYKDSKPTVQTAINFAFDCMVKDGKYLAAIKFYVNHYIENPNTVAKVNINDFLKILRKNKYCDIKRCIELPIFVGLNAPDDAGFILQSFCKVFHKQLPSELFEDLVDIDIYKVECFYNVVYRVDTLRHNIYINSTLEHLQEQQRILSYLVDLKTSRQKEFQEQLDVVSNGLIVYEGSRKLDESKIFVNDQAIVNNELKDVDGLFNRFKTIYKLIVKDKVTLVFLSEKTFKIYAFDSEKENKDAQFSENALGEVFYSIVDMIRDKFLNSKYGIVAYLSTRIRHGVLEGELRPKIEEDNLIFNKTNGIYVSNNYWMRRYGIEASMNDIINLELTKFSEEIDSILFRLIKQRLQIKDTTEHKEGLFDYDITNKELENWVSECAATQTYQECCWVILRKLWDRTEQNLKIIRKHVENDIRKEFDTAFNNLRTNMLIRIKQNDFPEIYNTINAVATNIDQRVVKIVNWFKISGADFNDFELSNLLDLVWENTSKSYPKKNAKLTTKCINNLIVKGEYYTHFIDVFRILLDNMFKYGYAKEKQLNLEISCNWASDEILQCVFSNFISEKQNIEVQKYIGTLTGESALYTEKGTGIYKARKIVQYDLECISNDVQVKLKDDMFVVTVDINVKDLKANEANIDSRR